MWKIEIGTSVFHPTQCPIPGARYNRSGVAKCTSNHISKRKAVCNEVPDGRSQ
jgi:hypothetical protein